MKQITFKQRKKCGTHRKPKLCACVCVCVFEEKKIISIFESFKKNWLLFSLFGSVWNLFYFIFSSFFGPVGVLSGTLFIIISISLFSSFLFFWLTSFILAKTCSNWKSLHLKSLSLCLLLDRSSTSTTTTTVTVNATSNCSSTVRY